MYYSRKEAEKDAEAHSKVFPKYKFTVRTVKGRHQDYFTINTTLKRAPGKAKR